MVDHSVRRNDSVSSFGSEVVKVRRIRTLPIDGEKLKRILMTKGHITALSEDMGKGPAYLSRACFDGKLTESSALLLERLWNIKYDDYKPEEEKEEEPVIETKASETEIVTKYEALLKTIISQLSAINNHLVGIYKKLDEMPTSIWETVNED